VKSRILEEVLAYDLGCNDLMSDMLGNDYQSSRYDYQDGLQAPLRCLECRKLEYR
jgi:hypothetical protein